MNEEKFQQKMNELENQIDILLSEHFYIKDYKALNDTMILYGHKINKFSILFEIPKKQNSSKSIAISSYETNNKKSSFFSKQTEYFYPVDTDNKKILNEINRIKAELTIKEIFKSK